MNFDTYQEGKMNKFGKEISNIFYRVEDQYIIYNCKNESNIFFDGSDEILKNISNITKQLAKIEIIINDKAKYSFAYTQLVYAIMNAAEGKIQEANEILDKLEIAIQNARSNSGRLYYILGSFTIILLQLILVAVHYFVYLNYKIDIFVNNSLLFDMSLLGSLGGFFSIIRRIKNIEVDSNFSFILNYISGLSRIVISIICSIFIFYLVKSNIVLGILNNANNNYYAIYVLAIISGFSENFVPNIFNKIEVEALGTGATISKN